MDLNDYKPVLRNDVSIDDEDVYKQHINLIKNNKYVDAATLLENNKQIDGVTASLLNLWEEKINQLCEIKNDFEDPYVYSQTEPSYEQMNGKSIWQQEY